MVEPCRTEVEEELAMDRVLTCTTATYICRAEPACNTALQYYNNYCTDMFTGQILHYQSLTWSDLVAAIRSRPLQGPRPSIYTIQGVSRRVCFLQLFYLRPFKAST